MTESISLVDNLLDVEHGLREAGTAPPGTALSDATVLSPIVDRGNAQPGHTDCRFLPTVIACQSLLSQFSHPRVRADFCNGRFGVRINPSLLPRIDEMRWVLFPAFGGMDMDETITGSVDAAGRFQLLIARSKNVCKLAGEAEGESLSYREWFALLELIASSSYWEHIPSQQRCLNVLPVNSENENTSNVKNKTVKRGVNAAGTGVKEVKPKVIKSSMLANTSGMKTNSIMEVLVDDSSNSESSGATDGSDSEISSSSSDDSVVSELTVGRRSRRLRKRRPIERSAMTSRLADRRDVVTPPMFEVSGRESLKEFLAVYESYFDRKFNGTPYDQTQELSKFIDGELLQVYNIHGGRKLKYEDMKTVLVKWYRKQKVGGRGYWRTQLETAQMRAGEPLDIYGMRLAEFSQRAYPKLQAEGARQLKKKFLESISPRIASRIRDAERTLKARPGKKHQLPFSSIIEMARSLQKELEVDMPIQSVLWTTSAPDREGHPRSREAERGMTESLGHRSREVIYSSVKQRGSEAQHRDRPGSGRCEFCGRFGHTKRDCWRASKSCLICGREHYLTACPRYDPNFKARGGERSPFRGSQPSRNEEVLNY